ncbi:hypothetical protein ACWD1W_33170 [Streptomyces olivaceoviridis]
MAASEAMSGRGDRSVHRLSPPVGGAAHRADQLQTARIVGDRAFAETPTGIEVRTDVDVSPPTSRPAPVAAGTRLFGDSSGRA